MDRRRFLGTHGALGRRCSRKPSRARRKQEAFWSPSRCTATGYLPLYIAMAKGYFAEDDINVKIVTIESGARPHQRGAVRARPSPSSAVPSTTPSPRSRAPSCARWCNCVDRGNVYFCAAQGTGAEAGTRLGGLFQGQEHRRRPVRRHAEFDHPLSAEEMEARRQERRDADRDRQFGIIAVVARQAGRRSATRPSR